MDNVTATNAEGTPINVYDVQRNNYGEIESLLVDSGDGKYRTWVKASDYIVNDGGVAVDAPVEQPTEPKPVEKPKQKKIPGRDAKLKPDTTITKPATAPVTNDLGQDPVIEK